MATSATRRIFISYARRDGGELARHLHADLESRGLDAWLDTRRPEGGASWTREIEAALDGSDVVLALLTPGSYASEICRAEQLRSLRRGKCVIPLLARRGTDIPLHLEPKAYRDFTDAATYAERFAELLVDVGVGRGINLPERYRHTYVTAPPLPANFVKRPEALAALRQALITDGSGRHLALTALRGMGGLGKTVLAQALCHDEIVQQAFPDGVIWVTVGKESTVDAVTRLRELGKALDDDLNRYDTELGCKNQYRSTLRHRAALIVVDDIWNTADLEPLLAESDRSRLLFTTRDASIAAAVGAQEHVAELLTEEQSRSVLSRWAGVADSPLPPEAPELIHECGRLPLALAMVGAMLRGRAPAMWSAVLDLLLRADLQQIGMKSANLVHTNLFRAIHVSVEDLRPRTRERYLALAVLLEDMAAGPPVQQALWGVDPVEALRTADELISLSLAQPGADGGGFRLHDLQLDYLRAQYRDSESLDLIHGAMRLSSHVIGDDPSQFASQLVGRLLPLKGLPDVERFCAGLNQHAPRPWLRPLWPALEAPGGPLRRTLAGHSDGVVGVAVSADGRLAVSASWDHTLKVWDLHSGRLLRTLQGHSYLVTGVAVSADGRLAVSASMDTTLKVWELDTGRLLRTLMGHTNAVNGVAASADGRRAVSAAADRTLKVWELETGRLLRTLKGHTDEVLGVAVSADGRRAVSASGDHTLKVWELDSRRLPRTLDGHSDAVSGVAVSANGRRAVSASADTTLKVWELDTGRLLRTLEGHTNEVFGVAVSADGRRAVSASWDRTLSVWDLDSGQLVGTLHGHSKPVHGVAVSADGRRVVSASYDHTLKMWELDGGRVPRASGGHSDAINGVAVSATGRRVVSASSDHTLMVWDLDSGRLLGTLEGHSDQVLGVAMSTDGRQAVSASADKTLKVWELESERLLRTLQHHIDAVTGVGLSADGRRAVSASSDIAVWFWELDRDQPLPRSLDCQKGHIKGVSGVAVSADGRRAVSASHDGTLKVWDLDRGRLRRTLKGHSGQVLGVAVSADGRRVVSGSKDRTLKLWDLESGRLLGTLEGHSGAVYGVAVSADGRRAVSASADMTLKLWDLDSFAALATFTCEGAARCCAFAGADHIVAGDAAGRMYSLALVG
jgi:WD40 repeat protein